MDRSNITVGLIGAGRIGTSHARVIAERVPGVTLACVADPRPEAARALADNVRARAVSNPAELLEDPDIDAVVIAASSEAHTDLIVAAAEAGKAVFCEKPAAMTLADADRAVGAAEAAGVALQVGFNRRFARDFRAAHDAISAGAIGTPQLMRSLTRDPGLANPAGVPPWTIFLQTLIHDFDTLLWLNPRAEAVEVYATADALVAPGFKDAGLLDTAVVVITFDNGARAVAEASFSARYGYDVRGEVFGSEGMVSAGDGAQTSMVLRNTSGLHQETARSDVELLLDAYTAEFEEFAAAIREQRDPYVTGKDARRALAIALACIDSVQKHAPVPVPCGSAATV
ncbi:MAG TPA: Gfo/Idh/MocA family oxidoreductase [Propionibacteriaceae bacterium]|nr:Gfo/Idh/MocA family oxidoreductase [Propionibacteriaceae bacterium]